MLAGKHTKRRCLAQLSTDNNENVPPHAPKTGTREDYPSIETNAGQAMMSNGFIGIRNSANLSQPDRHDALFEMV